VKRLSVTPRPPRKALWCCLVLVFALALCTPYPLYKSAGAKKRTTQVNKPRHPKTTAPPARRQQSPPDTEATPTKEDYRIADTTPVWESAARATEEAPVSPSPQESLPRVPEISNTEALQSPEVAPQSEENRPESSCKIRVALGQNLKKAIFSSASSVEIRSKAAERPVTQGSILCESAPKSGRIFLAFSGGGTREIALPCTLASKSEFSIIQYRAKGYRGSMILSCGQRGGFTVVNCCDIEDYLRGVVPLEIGWRDSGEIEAVKAQAIAARTYTYKKIQHGSELAFDLLPDISDQVYGGINAENTLCNQAIRTTRGLVIVYPKSTPEGESSNLIFAYYHSTCGGRTANVEDVWEKPRLPYLRSIDDRGKNSRPFCSGSGSFSWEETWPIEQLSKIVRQYSQEAFPQNPALGTIKKIHISARFPCGRTKACTIMTSEGSYTYGGDRLRFVLRRNTSGFPLLRSACITDISKYSDAIAISGKGFGHGVGMCQFGAIGRARAGQNYEQIIKAYYTGVEIRMIEQGK
jgi:stage II sporulation protein D